MIYIDIRRCLPQERVEMEKESLKYTKTHEWVKVAEDIATIGISDFAVKELSDIVFIEFPEVGKRIKRGSPFGTIESVKAAFDLNAPISGVVKETNIALSDNLDLLKEDPFGKGWMVKIKIEDRSELKDLMDFKEYQDFVVIH